MNDVSGEFKVVCHLNGDMCHYLINGMCHIMLSDWLCVLGSVI